MSRSRRSGKRKRPQSAKRIARRSKAGNSIKPPTKQRPVTRQSKSNGTKKKPTAQRKSQIAKPARKSRKGIEPASKGKKVRQFRKTIRQRHERAMLVFSDGKALHLKISRKNASTIGAYLNAVDEFLKTNDPQYLEPFAGINIRDSTRKTYILETRSNALYRLNAGIEPFEEVYRILT